MFVLIEEVTGGSLGRAALAVHAISADLDTADLLEIPARSAAFAIERRTHLSYGRPMNAESLRIRADRSTLQATLHRGHAPVIS